MSMLESLRHLALIADHGSFTAAARHAHLSQPALTASLRRLEEELDARLLDRGRHGASLTPAGAALLPHARAALVAIAEGRAAVKRLVDLEAGEVRIGGGSTACSYLLPPLLSQFRRRHPRVALVLRDLPEELAVEAFERGELDLVVAGGRHLALGELFREDEVVLVAAPSLQRTLSRGSGSARAPAIAPRDAPFIPFPVGAAVRALLDERFPDARIVMELSNISTVKGALRAGLGLALMSRATVATDLELGRLALVEHPGLPIPRPLALLHRGLARLSPAVAALRAQLLVGAPRRARVRKAARAGTRSVSSRAP